MQIKLIPFPIIVSAPSGTGKTTVIKKVVERLPYVEKVATLTTRPPRKGEISGKDYKFVSEQEFWDWVNTGNVYEYATVYGYHYATPKPDVERILSEGKYPIMALDIQGVKSMRKIFPDALYIFLIPPSWEEWRRRLTMRGAENIDKRMAAATEEINEWRMFDYVVVNDELEATVELVAKIIDVERYNIKHIEVNYATP